MDLSACSRIMLILLIVKNEYTDVLDLNAIIGGSDEILKLMKKVYQSESYKKAITTWLPFLDERGFLDKML